MDLPQITQIKAQTETVRLLRSTFVRSASLILILMRGPRMGLVSRESIRPDKLLTNQLATDNLLTDLQICEKVRLTHAGSDEAESEMRSPAKGGEKIFPRCRHQGLG